MNRPVGAALGDERRGLLLGAKLKGLLSEHLGEDRGRGSGADEIGVVTFAGGAAAVVEREAWVLVDGPAGRALGPSLAWAVRRDVDAVNVVADDEHGLLARRAAGFDLPVSVWRVDGRALVAADIDELVTPEPPPAAHLALASLISEAGAVTTVEHGVVTGEVRGLEVCRVVDEPTVGGLVEPGDSPMLLPAPDADEVLLEVGVGAHDREAFRLLHGDVPTAEALASVVAYVERHRRPGAPPHPLNRLARERFLRWAAVEEPASIGFDELSPASPPRPRPPMKVSAPCVAVGRRDGQPRVAVFSTGVDLDVVPFTVDAIDHQRRVAGSIDAATVVLPARDLLPVTGEIAALAGAEIDFAHLP